MSTPKKLLVHIGLHKTGSSAIQAWLAKNAAGLARHGIAYRNFREEASRDLITSGNGQMLVGGLRDRQRGPRVTQDDFPAECIPSYFGEHDIAVISSETLGAMRPPEIEAFKAFWTGHGIQVSVFAYCRTIYDHCYSVYQQMVKGSGETRTFQEFAPQYDNRQHRQLTWWRSAFGGDLHVRLYDSAKKRLIADFLQMLGLGQLPLDPSQDSVNRSLTFSELALLRRLNGYHRGTLSRALSDALIYADPSKRPDYYFDAAVAKDLASRFQSQVDELNQVFFAGSPDKLEVYKAGPAGAKAGSENPLDPQVETLLKTLGGIAADEKARSLKLGTRLLVLQAKVAANAEDWAAAAEHLTKALRSAPDDLHVMRQLAQAHAKLGQAELAQQLRRKVKRLEARASKAAEAS